MPHPARGWYYTPTPGPKWSAHTRDWTVINRVPIELLPKIFPFSSKILAVDCLTNQPITETTPLWKIREKPVGYVFRHGNQQIMNIDHHAPTVMMEREISAGDLAVAAALYDRRKIEHAPIILTHLDTDSIVSSLILTGHIAPKHYRECLQAIHATDHTGEYTDLGDLIASVFDQNDLRSTISLITTYFHAKDTSDSQHEQFSFPHFLERYRHILLKKDNGLVSFPEAVMDYGQKRKKIQEMFTHIKRADTLNLNNSSIVQIGQAKDTNQDTHSLWYFGNGVFLIDGTNNDSNHFLDNEFLHFAIPPQLQHLNPTVVLFSRHMPDDTRHDNCKRSANNRYLYEVKTRMVPGQKLSLKHLNLPDWGGRFNAGSTYRNGGTELTGAQFAKTVSEAIARA